MKIGLFAEATFCLFIFLGSSEFVFYFGSVRVISSGHCCVYLFRILLGARGFPCGSSFSLFRFVRDASVLRTDSSFLRDCLVHLVRKLHFGCLFAASFLFLFCFVYLFRTSLSSVFFFRIFLSACLILRYRNAVCLMRFTQLIHFMLQLVVSLES